MKTVTLTIMSTVGGAVGVSSTADKLTESTIQAITQDSKSDSNDPGTLIEKGEVIDVDDDTLLLSHEEQFPIDPNEELETQQFTFRAVLVGCLLGGVIAASKFVSDIPYKQSILTVYQCISWSEDWLDVRGIPVRLDLRLCYSQTPFEGPP